jgi:hypothetical protein
MTKRRTAGVANDDGAAKPAGCKFPVAVPRITLTEAIEIIEVTEKAQASIAEVPVWQE